MTVEILKSRSEYRIARAMMRRRGIDFTSCSFQRLLRKVGVGRGIPVGDPLKSWDVWKTVQFIERNVPPDSAILDLGAYASEIICVLHNLRYKDLTGIDLNPNLHRMPYNGDIRYVHGDFMHTSFPDSSFDAITAISVIEHGFDGRGLLSEMSRLLKPDGYFIASVDYWPEKIHTNGLLPFGVDWRIFSREELQSFLEEAGHYGMKPVGGMNFEGEEKAVKWHGKRYTFAWMALRKSHSTL